MNEELLRALQSGQITPAQYDMIMQGLLGQGGQQMGQATTEPEWQPPKYEVPRPNAIDPIMGQQMGSVPMPQAPAPDMPMIPMPQADQSPMQMSPMPEISGRGAPTQNETDFLTDFVNNRSSSIGSRGIDTPQERDYIQNIMQGYNKRY